MAIACMGALASCAASRTPALPMAPRAEPLGLSQAALDRIDPALQAFVDSGKVSGIYAMIARHGHIRYERTFGRMDVARRTPMRRDAIFRIYSMTKPVIAVGILRLVDQGRVGLDDPVSKYIPSFADVKVFAGGTADAPILRTPDSPITVRQLLNHTSGLPPLTGDTYEMVLNTDLGEDALEQRVRALGSTQLIAPPGEVFQYSNPGYATLALIVQTVSGESYEHYLQQHIYDPLQMRNSFVSKEEAERHGMATGYRYWFGIPRPYDWSYSHAELGAGFTISSAEDLTHYLIAQLNGGRYGDAQILSPEGVAQMHKPAVSIQPGGPSSSVDESYGMGWVVRETDGVRTVAHSGVAPNFHADLVLVPEGEWGIVLLMNGENGLHPERIDAIASGVTSLLVGKEPPPVAHNSSSPNLTLLRYTVVVDAILLIGMIWSVVTLRRWHARPERRPRGWFKVGWHVVVPLVVYLVWALVCLIGLPLLLRWPLEGLLFMAPDFGYTLVLSGVGALAWGVLRTVLVIFVLCKLGTPKEPDAPERSGVPGEA